MDQNNTPKSFENELDEAAFVNPDDQDIAKVQMALAMTAGTFIAAPPNLEDLQKIYDEHLARIGQAAMLSRIGVQGTYEHLLLSAIQDFSSETLRGQAALDDLSTKNLEQFKSVYDEVDEDTGKKIQIGSSLIGKVPPKAGLTGAAAVTQMLASRKGKIRRIMLPNSGFSIDTRVPSPDEINTLIQRSRADTEEYGRMFGAHFYMYFDLILKQNIVDLLMSLVTISSLQNWQKPGVLLQYIKLADLSLIMTEIAHLMYPNGYDRFVHLCTRPVDHEHPEGCSHTISSKISVNHLVRTKFGKLSKEALFYLSKARNPAITVSAKDVETYQSILGYDGQTIDFADFRFYLKSPSLTNYLEAGQVFNTELLNEISANNTKGIYEAIAFRQIRTFAPYIDRIVSLEDGEETQMVISDALGISMLLDQVVSEDDVEAGFIDKLTKFIGDTQLSAICYPAFTCPACGHTPHTDTGFFAVDPTLLFFTMAYRKLTPAS